MNPACIATRDELRGALSEKRSWRSKYYAAIEDKEAKARSDELWPKAVALFDYWKLLTGHKRSKWGFGRFEVVEKFLRDEGYDECRWAIDGLLRSKFHRENGYDEFERPFSKSQSRSREASFEYFNKLGRPSQATVDFFTWLEDWREGFRHEMVRWTQGLEA